MLKQKEAAQYYFSLVNLLGEETLAFILENPDLALKRLRGGCEPSKPLEGFRFDPEDHYIPPASTTGRKLSRDQEIQALELYINEDWITERIAQKLEVHSQSLYRLWKRHQLFKNPQKKKPASFNKGRVKTVSKKLEAKLVEAYCDKRMSLAAAAAFCKVGPLRARQILKEAGIKIRKPAVQPKLSEKECKKIFTAYKSGKKTQKQLAEDYGVSAITIFRILKRLAEHPKAD